MSLQAYPLRKTLLALCGLALLAFSFAPSGAAARSRTQAQAPVADVQVSHDTFPAHSEPAVAENPANPQNLVAASKFFSDPARYRFKIGTFYSLDGGRTWHDSGLLPGFDDYHTVSDVSVAFSRTGTAYVAVLACDGDDICPGSSNRTGVFVSSSTDGGKTFSPPVPVYVDTTETFFSDKPWIAVDQSHGPTAGTVYVAWNLDPIIGLSVCAAGDPDKMRSRLTGSDLSSGGIVVAHSTDNGKSFSAPVLVAPFTSDHTYIGAIPAVGPRGKLAVVYSTVSCGSGDIGSIDIATSGDRGAHFSIPRAVVSGIASLPNHLPNSTFRNVTMPSLAISPRDGSMVVVWADERYGDADILATHSLDADKTWAAPVRVNHDRRGNGKDQFMPAVAVAPDGTFTCAWFDRRWDPGNYLIDEAIAQSRDDGRSFGRNIRVTRTSWDPAIDAPLPEGQTDNTFIGDYQGLAVDNQRAHPLWNDTQNGTSQEIRTAVVPVRLFTRH